MKPRILFFCSVLIFCFLAATIKTTAETNFYLELRLKFLPSQEEPLWPSLSRVRPATHQVFVIESRVLRGAIPRERNPQLSEDHIVIFALDAQGRELAKVAMIDPRLVRAEYEDPSGKLVKQILYRRSAEFTVSLPHLPQLKSLKIYQANWTGSEITLELIGETELR